MIVKKTNRWEAMKTQKSQVQIDKGSIMSSSN